MTDINPTLTNSDIIDFSDETRVRLDQAGDRLIAQGESPSFDRDGLARDAGIRQAVRSDIATGRDWARERARMARSRIEDKPLKATTYALGLGVLIGLLLRR